MRASRLEVIERIILTLWVGALWAIGYLAVPLLFSGLDDRRLAGELAGEMFKAVGYVGLVSGIILLVTAVIMAPRRWLRQWRNGVLIGMLALIAIGLFGLQPYMQELKAQGLVPGSIQAAKFGKLHGVSSGLYLMNSLMGLVLVIFGTRPQPSTWR